ncbi:MAG: response regulator [Magnetococcales bacterium]|nr:response regulator [Magnetococcales bacterium]
MPSCILVVEDDLLSMELLKELLSEAKYSFETAENGHQAIKHLEATPDRFNAVLLDRMMPGLDGLEVLNKIKSDDQLKALPVIFQTAKSSREDILEGLQAGAHYYITKPFEEKNLLAVVNTAVTDHQRYQRLQSEIDETLGALRNLKQGEFTLRSLNEARKVATLLAVLCPDPQRTVLGLSELLVNAVEHGNLGIGYDEKSKLNDQGEWKNEVKRRLDMPAYQDRHVSVFFERQEQGVQFLIKDQGPGFDWQHYLEFSPERAFDTHGRGIALAKSISFDHVEYLGNGNTVKVTVNQEGSGATNPS